DGADRRDQVGVLGDQKAGPCPEISLARKRRGVVVDAVHDGATVLVPAHAYVRTPAAGGLPLVLAAVVIAVAAVRDHGPSILADADRRLVGHRDRAGLGRHG